MHQLARSLFYIVLVFLVVFSFPSLAVSTVLNYTYDNMHRLIRVEYETETVIDRTYDALGNRLTETTSQSAPVNDPPNVPDDPSPANAVVDINPAGAVLSWTGGDPDPENSVSYDVYFGDSPEPFLGKVV